MSASIIRALLHRALSHAQFGSNALDLLGFLGSTPARMKVSQGEIRERNLGTQFLSLIAMGGEAKGQREGSRPLALQKLRAK
jgi:hypothetical protein